MTTLSVGVIVWLTLKAMGHEEGMFFFIGSAPLAAILLVVLMRRENRRIANERDEFEDAE